MNAKNFRIGNLVKYKDRVFRVYSLAEEFPTLDTTEFGVGVVDWNNLKPIELTDYWTKRLGFNDEDYREEYIGISVKSRSGIETDFILMKPYSIGEWQNTYIFTSLSNTFIPLKYVHELQNLFFAINGYDLEVRNMLNCSNCKYENSKYDKYCNDCIDFCKYEKAI